MSQKENYDGSTPLDNKKREVFCQHYVIKYNGADAARKSGYSEKAARVTASNILADTNVKARIQYLQSENLNKKFITKERVTDELANIAFSNIQDFIVEGMSFEDFTKLPREVAAAIHSVEVEEFQGGKEGRAKSKKIKFKLHDKLEALRHIKDLIAEVNSNGQNVKLEVEFKGDLNKLKSIEGKIDEIED